MFTENKTQSSDMKNQQMLLSAFYYTFDKLNMLHAPLCPSLGTHDFTPVFTTWNVRFLGLDGG
jgi:hypothetical protein